MADDKGGGGGGPSWGPLEIIVVVLLVIALLDRITGTKVTVQKGSAFPEQEALIKEDAASTCGLSLLHPQPLEKAQGAVSVSGSVSGCDWNAKNGIALYAQVVDSRGKLVSSYTPIPGRGSTEEGKAVAFYAQVPFTVPPSKGTGYLILVPAEASSQNASTRIPLSL